MPNLRISRISNGEIIAEGPLGLFGITSFEGNYYISRSCLRTKGFKLNWIPGLCVYKFLYIWLDFRACDGELSRQAGWLYWLPNPIFFFIAFRVAVPQASPYFRADVLT